MRPDWIRPGLWGSEPIKPIPRRRIDDNEFVRAVVVQVSEGVTQLVVLRLVFCCKLQPAEGEGQETTTVLVVVAKIFNIGAPGVCTAWNDQNPPITE
jgi:hypothetical protein